MTLVYTWWRTKHRAAAHDPKFATVRKRCRNNADRGARRIGVVPELRQLPDPFFAQMFRMPLMEFGWLVEQIAPIVLRKWTAKSSTMAAISSGSRVDPFLMLASTIRWLSGGSIYDIAFGFKVAHQTVDAYKWRVMKGIKAVLAGNIRFPTSPDALRVCSAGFDQITRAVPNVIAAVDGVIFETIAPTAADFEDHPAVQTAIGQDTTEKDTLH